jgi:RNA polymerase sigma-70 factor (ECF subfamily)
MGEDRLGTLRAAGAGDERAFGAVWRHDHAAVLRFMQVMAGERADEAAVAAWVVALPALRSTADETSWRLELFAAAHLVGSYWGRTPAPSALASSPLLRSDSFQAAQSTLAVRLLETLPRRQREVLALQAIGSLSSAQLALVLGRPEWVVHRLAASAATALARVQGVDSVPALLDDLARALRAEPARAELAGYTPVLAAYRREYPRPRVVAVLHAAETPAATRADVRPRRAGRLAAALLAGGLGTSGAVAAAYAGVLPDPVQRIVHQWIDAPAPGPHGAHHTRTPAGTGPGRPEPASGRSGVPRNGQPKPGRTTGHPSHRPTPGPSHGSSRPHPPPSTSHTAPGHSTSPPSGSHSSKAPSRPAAKPAG